MPNEQELLPKNKNNNKTIKLQRTLVPTKVRSAIRSLFINIKSYLRFLRLWIIIIEQFIYLYYSRRAKYKVAYSYKDDERQ